MIYNVRYIMNGAYKRADGKGCETMAPKNKFTKEAMADAALRVVRTRGIDGLTAKTMADELGTSTQPIFTSLRLHGRRKKGGLRCGNARVRRATRTRVCGQKTPFFGVGMQYIRFAREEPELYRLLFLSRKRIPARWRPCAACTAARPADADERSITSPPRRRTSYFREVCGWWRTAWLR